MSPDCRLRATTSFYVVVGSRPATPHRRSINRRPSVSSRAPVDRSGATREPQEVMLETVRSITLLRDFIIGITVYNRLLKIKVPHSFLYTHKLGYPITLKQWLPLNFPGETLSPLEPSLP